MSGSTQASGWRLRIRVFFCATGDFLSLTATSPNELLQRKLLVSLPRINPSIPDAILLEAACSGLASLGLEPRILRPPAVAII